MAMRVTLKSTCAQQRRLLMVSAYEHSSYVQSALMIRVLSSKYSKMTQEEIMTKSQLPERQEGILSRLFDE